MELTNIPQGKTTTQLFEIEKESDAQVEICVAKPGLITGGRSSILRKLLGIALWASGVVETIQVEEVVAAMLEKAVHGFDGLDRVMTNKELVECGNRVLKEMKV